MPLYEYRCETCNEVFEAIQKFADEPLSVHDGCGGKVNRLLSAPAFHLKGSGWYITDYARSGAKKEAKAESKAESKADTSSKPESKSESKTESKPATVSTPAKSKSD